MTELAITKCIFENSAWVNYYKILTEKLVTCPRSSTHWLMVIGLRLWKMNIFNLNRSFQSSFNNQTLELGIPTILLKPGNGNTQISSNASYSFLCIPQAKTNHEVVYDSSRLLGCWIVSWITSGLLTKSYLLNDRLSTDMLKKKRRID